MNLVSFVQYTKVKCLNTDILLMLMLMAEARYDDDEGDEDFPNFAITRRRNSTGRTCYCYNCDRFKIHGLVSQDICVFLDFHFIDP